MGKFIKIVAALFVVAMIGVAVVISTLDVNQYKGDLIEAVEQATGRELQIGSDLQFAVSLIPTVVIEDVKFSNASWGSKPEMLTLNKFEIEVALLPLLSGNIQVNRVIFLEPDIFLETNKNGEANWDFSSKKPEKTDPSVSESGTPLPAITINELHIENATIHYKDGVTVELSGDEIAYPVPVNKAGTWAQMDESFKKIKEIKVLVNTAKLEVDVNERVEEYLGSKC